MVKLNFIATPLIENERLPVDHPEEVELVFENTTFVQLTYEWLRVGPEGDHIAVYDSADGMWRFMKPEPIDGEWVRNLPDKAQGFSDVVIEVTENR